METRISPRSCSHLSSKSSGIFFTTSSSSFSDLSRSCHGAGWTVVHVNVLTWCDRVVAQSDGQGSATGFGHKNSVLGKRWRLPLGTHGALIFPKKIRNWCGESTVAFWNMAVTLQQLKRLRPTYWVMAPSGLKTLDSEGRCTCICISELLIYRALLDSELLAGSLSTPRFWVAETFLNYCTLYMYTSSKQCTKNWQHVWRHLCICRLCSHL